MTARGLLDLPDEARVWLFAADRDLTGDAAVAVLGPVREYVQGWTSHGRPVDAAAEIIEGRVLAVAGVISADELNAGVSGCGIDAMTRAVDAAAAAAGVRWMPGLDVAYRSGDAWRVVSRQEFRWLARDGVVTPRTRVLDLTPATLGANQMVRNELTTMRKGSSAR